MNPISPAGRPGQEYRIYSPESLGSALRYYRQSAGLTQEALAELAGVNRQYLSDLERGRQAEQVRRILRILRQLGVRLTLQKADW